jgi:3-dehydroquinate dehydratase / shikimate dehydrogenase
LSASAAVCLCLHGKTIEEDLRLASRAAGRVDALELRVDALLPEEARHAARFPGLCKLPVTLCVRRAVDGGAFAADERERVALIERIAGGGFQFAELEEDVAAPGLDARVAKSGARIVRTLHDQTGVPRDLAPRIRSLARGPAELPKAAVTVKDAAGLLQCLEALRGLGPMEKILYAAGEAGLPLTVLAGRLGSAVCYAHSLSEAETLLDLYRFRHISAETAVYGVIGNPIMHSRSPLIHNTGFKTLEIDAVYLPFHVPDLEAFWKAADILGVRGLSVTVPHKQAVMSLLSERDAAVDATGACNTMVRDSDGVRWRGTNTDVAGFLGPLLRLVGGRLPAGLGATVIGAGGAARAVAHALRSNGARVLVLNRSIAHAKDLAEKLSVSYASLNGEGFALAEGFRDLIVQTTNVGMSPAEDADPAPGLVFTGKEIVFDVIYSPPMTRFLRRASDAGCTVLNGSEMLLEQAREQFRLFTGHELRMDSRYPP